MSGPMPISNVELLAFFTLESLTPESWEISAIRALDRVALNSMHKEG